MGEPETEEGSALELLKFSDVLDYLGEYLVNGWFG